MDLTRLSHLPRSPQLLETIKASTDSLVLAFSGGKDSLATWLYLRDAGIRIVPYFMYLAPGLRSDSEALDPYEQYFGQRILRLPHPALFYDNLMAHVYMPPHAIAKFDALGLKHLDLVDYTNIIGRRCMPGVSWIRCAQGFRVTESLYRRGFVTFSGVLSEKQGGHVYPIWDWSLEDTLDYVAGFNLRLPKIYRVMGRNFASIEWRDMNLFYKDYPDDIEKIKRFFPLIGAEFFRNEVLAVKYAQTNA